MFDSLTSKLQNAFKNLRGLGKISEGNVSDALREVRMALLEADVNFKVARDFIERVKTKALGAEVIASVQPGQQIVKFVSDELVALLGSQNAGLNLSGQPSCVMMVGLHGSGKTTSSGKLARLLLKQGRAPLLVAADVCRPAAMDQLAARISGPEAPAIAQRIRNAYEALRLRARGGGFSTCEFDRLFFGEVLADRNIDARIRRSAAKLNDFSGAKLTAADCAAAVHLSPSRFLHLFKQETGISFRAFRAWKRARHLLHFVNEEINFAHLAQDIGYPDSTHFSHSIRRFYGLKPRAIFTGSRDLAIYRSETSADRQPLVANA